MKYFTSFKPSTHTWDFASRAVQAGISGFEVVFYDSYLNPEVHNEYVDLVKRIKGELDVGFVVHAPVWDLNIGSNNRKIRQVSIDEIITSLDFARELDASLVVVHPSPGILNMPVGEWSKQEYEMLTGDSRRIMAQENNIVESLQKLADYAPDVLIGVENLVFPHEAYRSPHEMKDLIVRVNRSNVGLTLDVGHAQVSGHNPASYIDVLRDELYHVHLHDNYGTIDEHLPLGEGVIDYVGIIQLLRKIDYLGVVNLEFTPVSPADYERYLLQLK